MRRINSVFLLPAMLFFVASTAGASESGVNDARDQRCSNEVLGKIGNRLGISGLRYAADGGKLVSAACQRLSGQGSPLIAALAYDGREQFRKSLLVAMLDDIRGIVGTYKSTIQEDTGLVVDNTLRIGPTVFSPASRIQAFEVRMMISFRFCSALSSGPTQTFFISDGDRIRPVLEMKDLAQQVVVTDGYA